MEIDWFSSVYNCFSMVRWNLATIIIPLCVDFRHARFHDIFFLQSGIFIVFQNKPYHWNRLWHYGFKQFFASFYYLEFLINNAISIGMSFCYLPSQLNWEPKFHETHWGFIGREWHKLDWECKSSVVGIFNFYPYINFSPIRFYHPFLGASLSPKKINWKEINFEKQKTAIQLMVWWPLSHSILCRFPITFIRPSSYLQFVT